jgi:putative radical SAM enzyme (TIGR03279 family)
VDVQFYAADERVTFLIERGGREMQIGGARRYDEPLGLEFEGLTFDVPVRCCDNDCPFCFVVQMPPRRRYPMRPSLYVRDDDYRYSFLYGQYVTLTNLSDADWDRIAEQKLSPLYISVHATDPDARRRALGNPDAGEIVAQLEWLGARGIRSHTQIVVVPGLNDGDVLDESLSVLSGLQADEGGGVLSVSVVPVGLTKFHRHGLRPNTPDEARDVLALCEKWRARKLEQSGDRFVYPSDEWYLLAGASFPPLDHYGYLAALRENGVGLVPEFHDEWAALQGPAAEIDPAFSRLTLVTGALFAPILSRAASELYALSHNTIESVVVPVANDWFGTTVTVAGLLTAADVVSALEGRDLGEIVVLPGAMFSLDGVTLDDWTPDDIAAKLKRPVALAEGMGDLLDVIEGVAGPYS